MNGIKIFKMWAFTVMIGSVTVAIFAGVTGQIIICAYILVMMLGCSALFSLPTLFVLLIVNHINADKSIKKHRASVNIAHIAMFLITVVAGNIYLGDSLLSLYTGVVVYYAVIAILVWTITIATGPQAEINPGNEIRTIENTKAIRKELDF